MTSHILLTGGAERRDLGRLLGIRFDHSLARERLLGVVGHRRELLLDLGEALLDPRAGDDEHHDRRGRDQRRPDGQAGAQLEHQHQGDNDEQAGAEHGIGGRAEQLPHRREVVGGPRHEVAGAITLKEGRLECFEVSKVAVA